MQPQRKSESRFWRKVNMLRISSWVSPRSQPFSRGSWRVQENQVGLWESEGPSEKTFVWLRCQQWWHLLKWLCWTYNRSTGQEVLWKQMAWLQEKYFRSKRLILRIQSKCIHGGSSITFVKTGSIFSSSFGVLWIWLSLQNWISNRQVKKRSQSSPWEFSGRQAK